LLYVFLIVLAFATVGSIEARLRRLLAGAMEQHRADLQRLEQKIDELRKAAGLNP
jgi:hypothetical protein